MKYTSIRKDTRIDGIELEIISNLNDNQKFICFLCDNSFSIRLIQLSLILMQAFLNELVYEQN